MISGLTSRPSRIAASASLISSTNRYAPTQVISRVTRSPSTAEHRGAGQVAHLDERAAAGGRAQHVPQRGRGARRLEHQLGVVGQGVARGEVADLVGAHGLGDGERGVADVRGDDGGRAAVLGRGDDQGADRAGPVDDDVAAAHVAGPVHGVQRDGQRLGERSVLRAHASGSGRIWSARTTRSSLNPPSVCGSNAAEPK